METTSRPRLFAVIPAAGHSRRMGRPKLLLPLGDSTVIGQLLRTLSSSGIDATFVLVRPDDTGLRDEVHREGAIVVQPTAPPPEMRFSVEHLLEAVRKRESSQPTDGWLLVPGDHPLIQPQTLGQLIETWRADPSRIVLPAHDGRRGHPTLFPWDLAEEVAALPGDVGVNHLLKQHADKVVEVPVDDPTITLDLDTPEDYERVRSQFRP